MVQYGLFQPLQEIQRVFLLCGMVLADCETFPVLINETFLSCHSPSCSSPKCKKMPRNVVFKERITI